MTETTLRPIILKTSFSNISRSEQLQFVILTYTTSTPTWVDRLLDLPKITFRDSKQATIEVFI